MVDDDVDIPVVRQCELLGLSRSSLYYQSRRDEARAAFEWRLLNAIDELYTARPHLGRHGPGAPGDALAQERQIEVNPKRVRRLMKKLGLEAVYPRPRRNASQACPEHPKYPYLLRNLDITAPDQVWCTDITYIRLCRGFAYLVAVMDWFSRCVLSWELSNTLDTSFCIAALRQALASGRRPGIFNTDQGSQFTSEAFTGVLASLYCSTVGHLVKRNELAIDARQCLACCSVERCHYERFDPFIRASSFIHTMCIPRKARERKAKLSEFITCCSAYMLQMGEVLLLLVVNDEYLRRPVPRCPG